MSSLLHPTRDQIRLEDVLAAMGHPIRMEIVRQLAARDQRSCSSIPMDVTKSTLTHHFRVLRESGVVRQQPEGREHSLSLRRDDLDARFPGLLDAVLGALLESPLESADRM